MNSNASAPGGEQPPEPDITLCFGDDLICPDAEERDRDYYRWRNNRWEVVPCINNLIVDTYEAVAERRITTSKASNIKLALGARQRIRNLVAPSAINWDTRCATPLSNAVCAKNGVVHLQEGGTVEVQPYSSSIFTLTTLPYNYDPAATCPRIDEWLLDRLGDDEEQVQAFWEFVGSCLRPGNQYKSFMLFVGEGNTGKTSALNLVRDILGEGNCSSLPATYLNVPSVTPQVRGKLVNISEEKTNISASCEETIKDWVSGGPVFYNPKFRSSFNEPATAKLLFSMNRLPEFNDSTHAVYNRAVILTWTRPIALDAAKGVEEIRRELAKELPGALNRAIAAKHTLEQRGRVLRPAASAALAKELQRESNAVTLWFHERCQFAPNATTDTKDAFQDFTMWAGEQREKPLSNIQFGKQLRNISSLDDGTIVKIRVKRARKGEGFTSVYEGLRLLPEQPKKFVCLSD